MNVCIKYIKLLSKYELHFDKLSVCTEDVDKCFLMDLQSIIVKGKATLEPGSLPSKFQILYIY